MLDPEGWDAAKNAYPMFVNKQLHEPFLEKAIEAYLAAIKTTSTLEAQASERVNRSTFGEK